MNFFHVFVALMLLGCAGAKVRYDAAPSPVDNNYHTVLLEAECGGSSRTGFGQVGCSYAHDEKVSGKITIHTPLPGSITLIGRNCGVDQTDYHADKGGSFQYDLSKLVKDLPLSCVVDIYVRWELPPQMTSEYPLKGMLGKVYLRRRSSGSEPLAMEWNTGVKGDGVVWGQFREIISTTQPQPLLSGEPLALRLKSPAPAAQGEYRLAGCGQGASATAFAGDGVTLSRDTLLGPTPKKSGCLMLGYLVGVEAYDPRVIKTDAAVGVEVFGGTIVKLPASVHTEGQKVCYDAPDAVSLAVLNYGTTNQGSNDLSHCFTLPDGVTRARLGLFTHQGRAYYATFDNGQLTEEFQ